MKTSLEEAVADIVARHDESAKRIGFRRCGCDACKVLRPFLPVEILRAACG